MGDLLPTVTPACAALDADPDWWSRDTAAPTLDNLFAARLCSGCPARTACAIDYAARPDPETVNGANYGALLRGLRQGTACGDKIGTHTGVTRHSRARELACETCLHFGRAREARRRR